MELYLINESVLVFNDKDEGFFVIAHGFKSFHLEDKDFEQLVRTEGHLKLLIES